MSIESYDRSYQLLHWGLALFGIAAWLTGEGAEDDFQSNGFLLHLYLGFTVLGFVLLRFAVGLFSSGKFSFKGWSIFNKKQWLLAGEDIKQLFQLKLPHRKAHLGIAGIVQFLGLLLFLWMASSGTLIFLLQGNTDSTIFESIKEGHEIGEALIPVFLLLHVGAVLLHSLGGQQVWKSMIKKNIS